MLFSIGIRLLTQTSDVLRPAPQQTSDVLRPARLTYSSNIALWLDTFRTLLVHGACRTTPSPWGVPDCCTLPWRHSPLALWRTKNPCPDPWRLPQYAIPPAYIKKSARRVAPRRTSVPAESVPPPVVRPRCPSFCITDMVPHSPRMAPS